VNAANAKPRREQEEKGGKMNGELIPALAAAGGGSALIGTIWTYERRRDEAMRASRIRLALRFPASLDAIAARAALSSLAGLSSEVELLFEVVADGGGIMFFLWVPSSVKSSVVSVLRGAMPGLRAVEAPVGAGRATCAVKVFFPTPDALATDNAEAASRTLLSGLSTLAPEGERVVIRWAARPGAAPALRMADSPDRRARAIQQAWRHKTQLAGGFQVSGLVLVRAARAGRARELAAHVASAVRSRRGIAGGPRITYERGNRSLAALPKTTRSSGWLNAAEALPLFSWPLGDELIPGVEVGAARELLVPRHIPRNGRRLFLGRDSQGERPVALDAEAARHHVAVVGPSGVGKSVLLARGILDDIEHGFAGAVIDPKADLIETVLARVKPEHADRIVVLDPAASRIPGVAVLAGGDPDLRADVLTGAIRSAFPAEAWGVRTDFYLRLAIRTLAVVPGATLADVGRLFFEEPFRRAAVAQLHDRFLVAAWQSYGALSAAAQAEHVQAPMARIMALLSRPRVRAVLANPTPKLDVARLFAEKKWLLISLAPGRLGEAGAAIVGGILTYAIWSAIEGRVALAPERRHPIFLYVDELATLTNGLPFSFELLAERARGLGAGLTVAIQTLGRIPEPTRSALVGNVASFITFRAAAEEAQRLARQLPGLSDADVMALGRFEVAARIGTGLGSSVAVVTGRTEPLPPKTHQVDAIRRRSAEVYGSDPDAPQTNPRATTCTDDDAPLGRARRDA
jgi:hypothetical protein